VNPTVFYMFWSNRQAARQIPDPTSPIQFRIGIVDSGDVDIYGVELDAKLAITDRLSLDGNYAYIGPQQTHPTANSDSSYELPSYGLVNAQAQWALPNGRTVLSLFANNLLDETYATYATRFGGGYWDSGSGAGVAAPPRSALGAVRGRPREYGIRVQFNFE
jgi:iron complex outermembrane receptor protein